jgi:hypothetical protein
MKSGFIKPNFHCGGLENDAMRNLLILEREIGLRVIQSGLVLQPDLNANDL